MVGIPAEIFGGIKVHQEWLIRVLQLRGSGSGVSRRLRRFQNFSLKIKEDLPLISEISFRFLLKFAILTKVFREKFAKNIGIFQMLVYVLMWMNFPKFYVKINEFHIFR